MVLASIVTYSGKTPNSNKYSSLDDGRNLHELVLESLNMTQWISLTPVSVRHNFLYPLSLTQVKAIYIKGLDAIKIIPRQLILKASMDILSLIHI